MSDLAHPDQMSREQAKRLTQQIHAHLDLSWQLIAKAYGGRADLALGYRSWDEYCVHEFGSSRLKLPREARTEAVLSLKEQGLSTRAIAAGLGVNKETVSRDLKEAREGDQVSGIRTPEAPTRGLDGKEYKPRQEPAYVEMELPPALLPRPLENPDEVLTAEVVIDQDAAVQAATVALAAMKAIDKAALAITNDAATVAAGLHVDDWPIFDDTTRALVAWLQRVQQARPRGLRVVGG